MVRRRNTGRLYINCLVSLDLRTTKTVSIYPSKIDRFKPKGGVGSRGGKKAEKTYPVLPQHIDVPISQVPTPLIVVHALDFLAFREVVSNYASFHGLDPGFADVLLARLEFRCNVIEQTEENLSSAKRVHVWGREGGT